MPYADPERYREYQAAYRTTHRAESRAQSASYRVLHRDEIRTQRAGHYVANRERERARIADWQARNPERIRAYSTQHNRRRRIDDLSVIVLQDWSNACGVCGGELVPSARFPSPLSTSIGHEPPIAYARREDSSIITERYEHWGCNRRKGVLPDWEMPLWHA